MKLRVFLGGGLAVLLSAGSALAQSAGCTDVDSFFAPSSLIQGTFTTLDFDEGERVTLSADYITSDAGFKNAAAFRLYDGSLQPVTPVFAYPISGSGATDSGPVSESLVIPAGGITGLQWREDIVEGGFHTEFSNLSLSCAAMIAATYPVGEVAEITAAGQQRALSTSLGRNTASRLGGGSGNLATQNAVFISTKNMLGEKGGFTDFNAWVSFSGRSYFDGYDGHSADLLFGADHLVTETTLVGLMLGAGVSDLEDGAGNETETDSRLIGAYGAHRIAGSEVILEGYLAYAAVDYDTGADSFDTERKLAGLTLSGSRDVTGGTLTPRARLWGTWEDFPAGAVAVTGGTTRQMVASLGARFDWDNPIPGTSLQPFASLDIEYGDIDEVGGVSDDYLAPRLGLGVSGTVGDGRLALSLDAGRSTSDVADAGFELVYEMTF